MSCDGCSIAASGATNPSVEDLLLGRVPNLPKVVLHHPVLSPGAGTEFIAPFRRAVDGTLGAPYVVVLEGSVPDDQAFPSEYGYFSAMGVGGFDPQPRHRAAQPRDRLAVAPRARRGRVRRDGHLRHLGRHPRRRRQHHRLDEPHRLPRQGLPLRPRRAGRQHPRLLAGRRQLHRDRRRGAAVPPEPRTDSEVRRARTAGMAVRRRRSTVTARRPATTRRASSRRSPATTSASWRSAAGARSCSATSSSAAPSTASADAWSPAARASAARCPASPTSSARSTSRRPAPRSPAASRRSPAAPSGACAGCP